MRRTAAARAIVAFVLVAVLGGGAGSQLAGPLGTTYHEPVVQHRTATVTVVIDGAGAIAGTHQVSGSCDSVPDGTAIAGVGSGALGTLNGQTLTAMVTVDSEPGHATVELVPGSGMDENGAPLPIWDAVVDASAVVADGSSGRLSFTAVFADPSSKGGGETPAPGGGWPASIGGSIDWTCGD